MDERTIDIRKTGAAANLHPSAVFFHQRINPRPLPDALFEFGTWVADRDLDAEGPFRAVRCLLLNALPTFVHGTPWTIPDESPIDRAKRLVVALHDSVLSVQGPPGSGKTYTAAHMACALIRAGRKVGVTATSHRVIRNLLDAIQEVAAKEYLDVQAVHKIGEDQKVVDDGPLRTTKKNSDVLDALQTGAVAVAAGTVWLWARPEFQQAVDVLIVDEAGQMALANVLAAGQAARSLVLLGDPQQLEQPLQGSHPIGTDASVLQHVLGASKTLPDDRGLFLAETWRLAPSVCTFTSELFYEGRLRPRAGLERRRIDGPGDPRGAGLWFMPVEHVGNQNCSIEEVAVVCDLVQRLTGGSYTWTDEGGATHALTLGDVLIVAPYNAQVYAIQERFPSARVGTVDRFQGQQAPVVVYTMATSSPEDAPRGMEFLYSLNRLNVATSRAQCAVVLVASPKLFDPSCRTPREMQLANACCRYLEMATHLR
ncbi:MAG: AAA domain-containing protein [Vicinamibacterales bacterium]